MSSVVEVEMKADGKPDVGGLIAEAMANPGKSAALLDKSAKKIQKAETKAARRTVARLRSVMREALDKNSLGLAPLRMYSNWFGRFGPVFLGGLLKANKPKRYPRSKSGKRRKSDRIRGAKIRDVNRPFSTYGKRIRYHSKVSGKEVQAKVGMLREFGAKPSEEKLFVKMQMGGPVRIKRGGSGSMHGYFAALGVPLRRGTKPHSPKREFVSEIERRSKPDKMFAERFEEELNK
jgi:hypothetical protein